MRRKNYLFLFSHFWFATPQEVLQADWQEVWHSPHPPAAQLFFRSRVSIVWILFIVIISNHVKMTCLARNPHPEAAAESLDRCLILCVLSISYSVSVVKILLRVLGRTRAGYTCHGHKESLQMAFGQKKNFKPKKQKLPGEFPGRRCRPMKRRVIYQLLRKRRAERGTFERAARGWR